MKSIGNFLWGIILILIGVVFGLNALGITDINIFFDGWWTLFIIIPCFIGLFKDDNKTSSIIGIIIGFTLLLTCLNVLDFDLIWKLLVPMILIMIGLSIVFKDAISSKMKKELSKLNNNKEKSYCATFAGQDVKFDDEEFTGCELTAVFGGVKCDLREAIIKEDVLITTSSIFGSIVINVPSNVKVKVTSTPIFGGVDNKIKNKKEKTVYIDATCIFGGVEIK